MKIAVIILNYNGWQDTSECVKSLKNLKNSVFKTQIIVVDNDSNDDSKNQLSKIKDIILIQSERNIGYSGGNNLGIKKALDDRCDYMLILNNDTFVDKSLIQNLTNAAKKADIIAPKIYFAPGYEFHKNKYKKNELGNVIWFAGGKIDWKNIIGYHLGVDEVDKGQFSKTKEIDFATGACMLVSRKVFEKIGLFDEKYFLYLEDMDFCYRAKKAGFKTLFEPKAIIWHKNAQSAGGSGSVLQDYYISRNRLLFAFKFASLRTKIAVFKQVLMQINNKIKRAAIFDFLMMKFYERHA